PKLGAPAIYVAQPYGGMDPSQMEGYLTYYYEYHFLYITGIEHVESKNIQGVALMKLVFHPDTDMSQAMGEVVGDVNWWCSFLPSGNVRTGDLIRIASTNATLGGNIQELLDAPLRMGTGPTVYLRDIGTITDTADIVVGYAHVDDKRTVYIPVTKRADASTL